MHDRSTRGKPNCSRRVRLAALETLTAAALSILPVAAGAVDPFAGLTPLSDAELSELRGGFNLNGAIIHFGGNIQGHGKNGQLIFETVLTFPAAAGVPEVNGVGVQNFGPIETVPTVTALPGGSGKVKLKAGDLTNSPFVIATFPAANTTVFNIANDAVFSVQNTTTIEISNASALLGGLTQAMSRIVNFARDWLWY